MDYEAHFRGAVASVRAEGRYRVFADLARQVGRWPRAEWLGPAGPREVVIWCSNDYLGLGHHPAVLEGACAAVRGFGAGAGGTRNISGTTRLHVRLEEALARLHGKPAALLFTSGYVANEAAISTIARLLPGCLILSDAHNHASMIAGIRAAGGEKQVFRHNDLAQLEQLLAAQPREAAEAGGVRGGLLDGRRFRPGGRDLRAGPALRGADLPGRGARGRHVRGARGGGGRARRGDGRGRRRPGRRWARRSAAWAATSPAGPPWSTRCAATRPGSSSPPPCRRPWSAGPWRRCGCWAARRARPCAPASRSGRPRLKLRLAAAGLPVLPSPSHIVPLLVGDPVRCKAACDLLLDAARHLHPADQLPDRPPRHRTPAPHPRPRPRRRAHGPAGRGARGGLGRARDQARCLTAGQSLAAWKVSQLLGSPVCRPCLNQRMRCCGAAMGEGVRNHIAARGFLDPVVADGTGRVQRFLDVTVLEHAALVVDVAGPDAGEAVGL